MVNQNAIAVGLNEDLVRKLLNGLYGGAKGKALKVVVTAEGNYFVESKELRLLIEIEDNGTDVKSICIFNEKHKALVTARDLAAMQLSNLAADAVRELKSKYSPVFHSLADNIAAFSRTYGGM